MSTSKNVTDQAIVALRAGLVEIPEQINGHPLLSATIYEADSPDWLVEILWGQTFDIFGLFVAPLAKNDSDETDLDAFGLPSREIVKNGILMSLKASDSDRLQSFANGLTPSLIQFWAAALNKPTD